MALIRIVMILCFSFLVLSCSEEKKETQTSETSKVLEVSEANFNPETLEFIKDEYTMGLWHFNEGRDVLAFDSENFDSITGLLEAGARWSKGVLSQCLNLLHGGFVIVDDEKDELVDQNAVTVEFLLNISPNQVAPYPTIIHKASRNEGGGYPNYAIWFPNHRHQEWEDDSLIWILFLEGGKKLGMQSHIYWKELADEWHYIACTYNGKISKIYIDGELKNSKKGSGKIIGKGLPLRVGRWGGQVFRGLIDELRISKVARSEKAIRDYWNAIKNKVKK